MRLLLILCLCALCSCKSTRTIVAGPRNVGGGYNDYSPEREAQGRKAGEAAAASGVSGSFGSGGAGFNQRFGTFDPGGYGSDGLNSMSQQMYGGNTNSKDMKSFTQTRDFLAKRYSGTREFGQKTSSAQGVKSWFSNKKASAESQARESGSEYSGSSRVLANKTSSSEGRTVKGRTAREEGRTSAVKEFYPAKKVLDRGGDAPKIIGQGDKDTNESVWRLIKSRPRDNPASVEEIRALLGKSN